MSVVIQGITEFFPVSSSAHLFFFSKFLKEHQISQVDAMALNLVPGLVFALYFYKDILKLFWGFIASFLRFFSLNRRFCAQNFRNEEYFKFFFWSVAPISLVGLLVSGFGISVPTSVELIAINSIVFGILLGWADVKGRQRALLDEASTSNTPDSCEKNRLPDEVRPSRVGKILGLAHVLSYIPGVSRLGICITATRFLGISRYTAIRVSFICGILPLIATGTLGFFRSFWKSGALYDPHLASTLVLHFGVMFPLGFASLHVFMRLAQKHGLWGIAVYRVLLGIGLLAMS
jgi:undecaprenyl-diphosphatase